ncbi:hypothetical protein [Methanobrevibacter sp. 87.7]|uniref:hypothetical protein n=1 Tax=Methanobrevibacter sp. 87.7 TaxID=387957 RepID=UPI00117C9382|nr:hypothetical protein [Methanobrevibacter sp. 87.7]
MIQNIIDDLMDNRIKLRNDLAEEHEEELNKFTDGVVPPCVYLGHQDREYLKKKDKLDLFKKKLKLIVMD